MIEGQLWRPSRQRVEKIHPWRPRRWRVGELVPWDTSEHAWLEDRGPKLYLISMIDDASSRLHARFGMSRLFCGTSESLCRRPRSDGRCGSWTSSGSGRIRRRPRAAWNAVSRRRCALVKGLRVAGAKRLEQANTYLEAEFMVWWNQTIAVVPASTDDAHRP